MSEKRSGPGTENLTAQVEEAARSLRKAADTAGVAQKRATAEIRALEADLEKERLHAAEALEELRGQHERDLNREREERERAIAAAESRLSDIEAHTEAAEQRVKAAERRATEAEKKIADAEARVREAAADWLRGQIEAIRREARQ